MSIFSILENGTSSILHCSQHPLGIVRASFSLTRLHRESEYYCSIRCENINRNQNAGNIPPFLSKWKIKKNKELKDPLVTIRKKIRCKSKKLIKEGRIKKRPCVVCGSSKVIVHHEDYDNPYNIIWLCEQHHKDYHGGEISLFNNKLWWNPDRLIPQKKKNGTLSKKYRIIKENFQKKKSEKHAEQMTKGFYKASRKK